jgi:hypothetical protein
METAIIVRVFQGVYDSVMSALFAVAVELLRRSWAVAHGDEGAYFPFKIFFVNTKVRKLVCKMFSLSLSVFCLFSICFSVSTSSRSFLERKRLKKIILSELIGLF